MYFYVRGYPAGFPRVETGASRNFRAWDFICVGATVGEVLGCGDREQAQHVALRRVELVVEPMQEALVAVGEGVPSG